MMRKIYLLLALTMMMVQGAWAEGLSGSGTSSDPYLIQNATDWTTFANSVNSGTTYAGQYVKLEANINASGTMAGVANDMTHSFQGTFDGGGYTITFSKGTSATPFDQDYCAPFRMVTNATIKNLKTEGTIYTSKNYAAGIVALTYKSTNTLENCHSGINIISTFYGGGIHGGLVAEGKGIDAPVVTGVIPNVTEFSNCSFYGSLQGEQTNMCSGLMGYTANTARFYNCLFVPSDVTISTTDCCTFGRGTTIEIDNCYYLTQLGDAQGSQCYASTFLDGLYTKLVAGNGNTYYGIVTVSGLKENYYSDGSAIDLGIEVKSATGINYALGTDYTLSIKRYADNTTVTVDELTQGGSYTLTVNAVTSGPCVGSSISQSFTVTAMSTGSGTDSAPFIIDSADDWNTMAAIVADGKSFSGKYVQLNEDITVSTMVGTESQPFSGTFNGNGKTLTLSLGTETSPIEEANVAPFRYIYGATIQNLIIDGAVYTAGQYASCLVGKADGTCLIKNCKNVATLSSSVEGAGYHGSYVGNANLHSPILTIEGCVFAGSLLGPNTSNVGGFVGNAQQAFILKSCLFTPASVTMSNNGSGTFSLPYEPILEDAFYTETLGEAQCNRAYSISAASDVNFGSPTVTYDVSGIDAYVQSQSNATTTYLLKYNGTLYGLSGQEISFTIDGANNCSIVTDGGQLITPTSTDGQYTFTMPEASVMVYANGDKVQVTIGDHGLNSFCSPYNLDFLHADEGVTAYVVNGFDPNMMSILVQNVDYASAGTGLVVKGEAGTTYNVPITTISNNLVNLLVGALVPTPITTTDNGYSNFILYNGSLGWNWYASAPGTLPAGKAYLRLPTNSILSNARSFTWIFEDSNPNGIQEVQTAGSQNADAWYSLDGIRLNGKPMSSGIYVNHGKKYIIK